MSRFLAMGLVLGVVSFASVQTASAGHHRQWGCNYSYGYPATAWTAPAPAVTSVPPAPAVTGPTAQANSQAYRSFSAEPAPSYQAAPAPVYGNYGYGSYDTVENRTTPYQQNFNYYGGFGGGSVSRGGTAGSPSSAY